MHTTMHTVAATREVGNNSSTRVLQGMHMHTLVLSTSSSMGCIYAQYAFYAYYEARTS